MRRPPLIVVLAGLTPMSWGCISESPVPEFEAGDSARDAGDVDGRVADVAVDGRVADVAVDGLAADIAVDAPGSDSAIDGRVSDVPDITVAECGCPEGYTCVGDRCASDDCPGWIGHPEEIDETCPPCAECLACSANIDCIGDRVCVDSVCVAPPDAGRPDQELDAADVPRADAASDAGVDADPVDAASADVGRDLAPADATGDAADAQAPPCECPHLFERVGRRCESVDCPGWSIDPCEPVDWQCSPCVEGCPMCFEDFDCLGDRVCVDNECRDPCRLDADCDADAVCDPDGRCRVPVRCREDGDCGIGEWCAERRCRGAPLCRNDADCGFDEICEDEACVNCVVDLDCGPCARCFGGDCAHPNICFGDRDCGQEQSCRGGCCVACEADSDCGDCAVCAQGVCQEVDCDRLVCVDEPPECRLRCEADPDCPADRVCEAGACVPRCSRDADCPLADGARAECVAGHCVPGG